LGTAKECQARFCSSEITAEQRDAKFDYNYSIHPSVVSGKMDITDELMNIL